MKPAESAMNALMKNRAGVGAGMVLVGIVAAGTLAKNKRRAQLKDVAHSVLTSPKN